MCGCLCCCLLVTGMLGELALPGELRGDPVPQQSGPGHSGHPDLPSSPISVNNFPSPPTTSTTSTSHHYNELKSPRTHLKIWVEGGQNQDSKPTQTQKPQFSQFRKLLRRIHQTNTKLQLFTLTRFSDLSSARNEEC